MARNARLNFRQQEENHIMENIIYNELLIRGFNVDVGVMDHSERNDNGKAVRNKHNTPTTQTTNKPKSSNNPTKTQLIIFTKSPTTSTPQDAPERRAAGFSDIRCPAVRERSVCPERTLPQNQKSPKRGKR